MRILHVNKFLYRRGGAEAYMEDVAALQAAAGQQVEFFAMTHPQNRPATYEANFPAYIELEPAPAGAAGQLRAAGRVLWSTDSVKGMAAVADAFEPDVAHLHNVYHQLSPSLLRPLQQRGVPVVMTLHDYKLACPSYQMLDADGPCRACIGGGFREAVRHRCKGGSLPASALLAMESWAHRATDAYGGVARFIAPSRFLAGIMTEAGVYPDRVRHVPHPVDVEGTVPKARSGGPVVFAGRLSAEKGVDTLIRAAGLAGCRVVVAGDGPAAADLQALADRVAPHLVTFTGRLGKDDVASLIRSATVVAVPSRWYENQPMIVLETLAAAVPVVASDMGGLGELVEHGTDGLLVPPDDPAALAEALTKLLADPEQAMEMGHAGRTKVWRDFSPTAHLRRLAAVYQEAAHATPARTIPAVPARRPVTTRPSALRVAMIGLRGVPASFGGIEHHVEELGARLAARGHEVTVYCRRGYGEERPADHRGMRLRHLPTVPSKHLEAIGHSGLATLAALRGRYDVIHYHALGPGLVAPLPRLFGDARVILTVHGLDDQRAKWGGRAQQVLRAAQWCSAHVPDATVVVSQDLSRHYAEAHSRITHCIPNGVEAGERQAGDGIRERFGLEPGGYVLFVGRLVPEKAPDLLVRAFARLGTNARLVITGGSSHSDTYVSSLARLAEQDRRVTMTGYVYGSLLAELYSNAAAFVLPSALEGMPLTLLEAASYGLPVLASDIPPHIEVLGTSGPGHRLFPSGDEAGLAAALDRMLAAPALEQAGAADLRSRVLLQYNWDRAAEATEAVYHSVLGLRRPIVDLRDLQRTPAPRLVEVAS